MLAIRMQRTGRKGHAMFRVIVQDSRLTPTSGKIVATLGNYDPHAQVFTLDKDKAAFYLEHGAQPSDRIARLLKNEGVKLPSWVSVSPDKVRDIRNPEKRRSTKAPEPVVEVPVAEEVAEVAVVEDVAPVAEDVVAEAPVAEEAPVADVAEVVAEVTPEVEVEAAPAEVVAETPVEEVAEVAEEVVVEEAAPEA